MKFYYLERGNYESNLELKFNIIDIPKTAIYKVDQYGDVVPGAKFAVYTSSKEDDGSYKMLSDKGGTAVTQPDNLTYAPNDDFRDDNGIVIAKVLYTGLTNYLGEMIFVDNEDNLLTLEELEELFGPNFILREIEVPDGYRVVTKDVYLEIWNGNQQTILRNQVPVRLQLCR